MGTRVLGLDIGESAIRGVLLDVSFRAWEVVDAFSEPIDRSDEEDRDDVRTPPLGEPAVADPPTGMEPSGDAPADPVDGPPPEPLGYEGLDGPTLDALGRLAASGRLQADTVVTNITLDELFLTRLSLPFSGAREVEAVLRPQLEGRLPADVDDLLVDFMVCGPAPNGENVIYTAGVRPEHLAAWLGSMESVPLDPRTVDVAPFPMHALATTTVPIRSEAIAWVDIGAERTGVLVVRQGAVEFAREFNAGGELVTAALSARFSLPTARARAGKHREARILDGGEMPSEGVAPETAEISEVCREALQPLVRQLRRTLQAHASRARTPVDGVVLCGGGSELPGLAAMLQQQLGVTVEPYAPSVGPAAASEVGNAPLRMASALGLALRGVPGLGSSQFNLRRDQFAFRGSHAWLLARLPALALAMAALVVAGGLLALGNWTQLRAERAHLDNALEAATLEIFGTPLLVPERIQQRLATGGGGTAFMPETSAYDLFLAISSLVGDLQADGTVIEARSIDVDLSRRLFDVRGTAESADAVDRLEGFLRQHPCLRNLQRQSLQASRSGDGFDFGISGAASCSRGGEEER